MNQASHPDANRLVYRIRTAIKGESKGLDTAKLALQYAVAIERANAALRKAADLIQQDRLLSAVLLEHDYPNLIEAATELDFGQTDLWAQRCRAYSWKEPESIDAETLEAVKSALDAIEQPGEWLFGKYRNAIRSKDLKAAYRIIRIISAKNPEDESAREERDRLSKTLIEEAAAALRDYREQLIPSEKPEDIIARYRDTQLPLEESSDPAIIEAIGAQEKATLSVANATVGELLQKAESVTDNPEWLNVEKAYLECEYDISVLGLRGKIDPDHRAAFETLTTDLSRLRNSFEADISLRKAVSDLEESLQAKGSQKGDASEGSPANSYQQRLEKLQSLEKQALRTSGQIAPELQAEIKEAYALANKRKLPKRIGLLCGSAAALVLITVVFLRQQENSALKQQEAFALDALHAAEASGSLKQAETQLTVYKDVIAEAQESSPLRQQADLLNEWIEMQSALGSEYDSQIQQFARLIEENDPMANQSPINEALNVLQQTRANLAPEIANKRNQEVESLVSKWKSDVSQAQRESANAVIALNRQIQHGTEGAFKAKSHEDYQRHRQAVEAAMNELAELLQLHNLQVDRERIRQRFDEARKDLQTLENKWTALEGLYAQLPESTDIDQHLRTLERISSFDIITAKAKTDIEQTLGLRDAIKTLKNRIAIPPNASAWEAISDKSEYASTIAHLDDEERAFVERLADESIFDNVYTSTVQYFEGKAEPQSEYQILLMDPISKSEGGPESSSVVFGFKVRGFDENGQAEESPREIQFISREDGSFWGFFYKPSTLSAESRYFREALLPAIEQLKAGSNRLFLLRQIERLEAQANLAPAFRAYWRVKFLELMSLHPWKWGMALSPSLKQEWQDLQGSRLAELSAERWRSTLEQTVPSPEFAKAFDGPKAEESIREVQALSDLYSSFLDGETILVGYVSPDGTPALRESIETGGTLWTVNQLTGQLERLTESIGLTPYAPILRYELNKGDAQTLLKRIEFATGLDLRHDRFAAMLPAALQ